MWKIEHRAYRLPFRQVVRTTHGPWAVREGVIVRAEREVEGRVATGWGEAAPVAGFGCETVEEAEAAIAGLEGRAEDLAEGLARMPEGAACARGAVAAALGGGGDGGDGDFNHGGHGGHGEEGGGKVKFLAVAGLLPAGRGALGAVEGRLELGFRTFKWKVGVLAAADEWALLDDLLGRLPAGAKLRLDANGAWDRRTAEGWLGRAAERPMIEYVEQPCFAAAGEGATAVRRAEELLLGLAEDYPVKIALDESVSGRGDVERWLAAGWGGVWVIKPALLGEPGPVLGRLAKAGADVVFGSALETGVGARAALRLAFGWAEARGGEAAGRRAAGFGVYPLFEDGRADGPGAGAFVRREDAERFEAEALWNALG